MTRRSDIDAALQDLYDQVPPIPDCQGKCWVSCGPADMSLRERQRMRDAGYRITPADVVKASSETFFCEALTSTGRCGAYQLRPMACRIWGAVEGMPCPYGCQPEGGYLTDEEGLRLLLESQAIGGCELGPGVTLEAVDDMMAGWLVNGLRKLNMRQDARGRAGIRLRIRLTGGVLPPQVTSRRDRKPGEGQEPT